MMTNGDGRMHPGGDDADDKVVVDPLELAVPPPGGKPAAVRPAEPRHGLARGTREHVSVSADPARVPIPAPPLLTGPAAPPRGLARDPVAVLRAWPHSTAPNPPP